MTESKIKGYINGWTVSSQESRWKSTDQTSIEEKLRVSDCFYKDLYSRLEDFDLQSTWNLLQNQTWQDVKAAKVTKGWNEEVLCHGMQPLVANGRGTQTLDWYGGLLLVGCIETPVNDGWTRGLCIFEDCCNADIHKFYWGVDTLRCHSVGRRQHKWDWVLRGLSLRCYVVPMFQVTLDPRQCRNKDWTWSSVAIHQSLRQTKCRLKACLEDKTMQPGFKF